MRSILLILVLAASTPAPASAVTLDEVVALSKSGVSEQVILAVIDRDQTLFSISPIQLVNLQREGLSDTVLLALLKSGRPQASMPLSFPPAPDTPLPATSLAPADEPPPPAIVVVGHAPDVPNAQSANAKAWPELTSMPVPVFVPVPYLVPHASRRAPARTERLLERTANPLLCVERVAISSSPFAPALTRVTECPAQMQRYRER